MDKWWDEGQVGNFFLFKAPRSDRADGFIERTIKVFEMNDGEKSSTIKAFESMDCLRMEMFQSANGKLDRVKITRRL